MTSSVAAPVRRFLHVGCGGKNKKQTTAAFASDAWQEIRFDIDTSVKPDIVGTMTDMSMVETASVDALFSSHNIEHLYPHEVPVALREFRRVVNETGFVVITCPDLKSVCQLVAEDKFMEPAYQSPAGPISPLDILYGHRASMERGNLFMAHRTGFTQTSMRAALHEAGFASIATMCIAKRFELWAVATPKAIPKEKMADLAAAHFPGVRPVSAQAA